MTQSDQVLTALQKIGGKGTLKEIFNSIDDIAAWDAKKPINSVGSILSGLSKKGQVRLEGKLWILKGCKSPQNSITKSGITNTIKNTLYLITIHESQRSHFEGLPFKIGYSKDNLEGRLKGYNASLPFETIELLDFYPIKLPKGISLSSVEKAIQSKLEKVINPKFGVIKLQGGNQEEWFIATDLHHSLGHKLKLKLEIGMVVKKEIENLRN